MIYNLEERFAAINDGSDFNELPFETREMIRKYNAEQQILTLYQVLHKHGDLTTSAWRAQIRGWLGNCIESYEREYFK